MSEIQSIEGRAIKKGMSPGRRSAYGALALLGGALAILAIGQLIQPASLPVDHVLAVVMTDGRVAFAKADGSAAIPFTGAGIPRDATAIRWAPGGDFIALETRTDIVIADRSGVIAWRKAVVAPGSAGTPTATFDWAPDGSEIAILDPNGGLDSTGAPRASLQVLSSTGELSWDVPLPDGFHVVEGLGNLSWSPDGRFLAVTGYIGTGLAGGQLTTAVWLVELEARAVTRLTEENRSLSYAPAWSGPALLIARESPLETGVWRIAPPNDEGALVLRTGPSCSAAPCPAAPLNPTPAPQPDLFAYRDPITGLRIYDTSTSQSTRVPPAGTVAGDPFEWAADGGSLLYLRRPAGAAGMDAAPTLVRYDLAVGGSTDLLASVRTFDLLHSAP